MVLEQPVHEDDVRPEELLAPRDVLAQDRPVMDDELEVEVVDVPAGVARARRRLAHVAPSPTEAEVAPLDRVEQQRPIDPLRDRAGQGGVALKLGEPKAGVQSADGGNGRRRHRPGALAGFYADWVLDLDSIDVGEIATAMADQTDYDHLIYG